jgi:hypothetical protein
MEHGRKPWEAAKIGPQCCQRPHVRTTAIDTA